jgi:hypothetical protein
MWQETELFIQQKELLRDRIINYVSSQRLQFSRTCSLNRVITQFHHHRQLVV